MARAVAVWCPDAGDLCDSFNDQPATDVKDYAPSSVGGDAGSLQAALEVSTELGGVPCG
jgi:hypothetical protein